NAPHLRAARQRSARRAAHDRRRCGPHGSAHAPRRGEHAHRRASSFELGTAVPGFCTGSSVFRDQGLRRRGHRCMTISPSFHYYYEGGSMQASYAKCIEVSKRIRWDIDRDVIRGRGFDATRKFLPDGLSKVGGLDFLSRDEKRLVSQIQGRTYSNMFGLVERYIGAKVLEISREHWFGDQTALEALVRFT